MTGRRLSLIVTAWAVAAWGAAPARADETLVAVAANFRDAASRLEADFERASGHDVVLTVGSTGHLYAQIVHGAPIDVLLAADQERPARLDADGLAVAGSRFTYAVGVITLWSPDPDRLAGDGAAVLRGGDFRRLAIADPDLAPYGLAAVQTMNALGVGDALEAKLVRGANISQAFAFVNTGAAELGFVALSSVVSPENRKPGSRWDPPPGSHDPIRQDAVLLTRGRDNPAAVAFLAYLKSDAARAALADAGYGAP